MKDYYRSSEVAKFLNVTTNTMLNWINAGKISVYITEGGHFRILREDLIKFMKKKGLPLPTEEEPDKYRILIVDDENNIIESVKLMLEDIGVDLEIETASDGFEAGIKAVRFLPHLIILDAKMPGAHGDRICILAREDPALKKTKVLVFTGYPNEGEKLLKLGAHKLIIKGSSSADVDEFCKEVRRLLGIKFHKLTPKGPTKQTQS